MAFLSRLFKRGDPLAEREEARRQGMRDARRHPLTTFTDPEGRPAFVAEVRAHAREQITEAGRRLAARRGELLERALAAQAAIHLELSRTDLLPHPPPNGHPPPSHAGPGGRSGSPADTGGRSGSPSDLAEQSRPATGPGQDHPPTGAGEQSFPAGQPPSPFDEENPFISIAEARWRREEARRREAVRESQESVQRAGARIEQYAHEWENALIEHDHEVAAVHARAEQLIAAYRSGVMETHPRREEIPPLWQGEVIAVEPTADTRLGISGREELGRIRREVAARVEAWHTQVLPHELPRALRLPSLDPPRPTAPESREDETATGRQSLADAHPTPWPTDPGIPRTENETPADASPDRHPSSDTRTPHIEDHPPGQDRTAEVASGPEETTDLTPPAGNAPEPEEAARSTPPPEPEEVTDPPPARDRPTGPAPEPEAAEPPPDQDRPTGPAPEPEAAEPPPDPEPEDRANGAAPGPGEAESIPDQDRATRPAGRRRTYSWRDAFGDPSATPYPGTPRTDPSGRGGEEEERRW
ncbi:hypothetical protein [Nonomuraea sp. NPDC048826]|uniref:hypothetical protein n=1 Tax=Nonomuraea sp. NPDC048826 TaxID=3364347 RepID=UPI00370FC6E1